jgi:two-component system response regulator FlrC
MNTTSNILLVEDQFEERTVLCDTLKQWGFHVTAVSDGSKGLAKLRNNNFSVVISDLKMPQMDGMELLSKMREQKNDTPVILLSGYGTVEFAVEAMKLGAFDFMVKPFSSKVMEAVVKRAVATRLMSQEKNHTKPPEITIITKNAEILNLLQLVKSIANSKAPVFIQGESGTGKELFARFVHQESGGHDKPFVALNCAALPDGLLESELFGHEKGAFTGAVAKKLGKFELADGGTILLDEISEMPITLQAKLLRVLQESEIDRVGGRGPIPINVRVIATTNQDIEAAVKADKFRADLYYRLNVIPIKIPPLRERKEDILPLAEHFIAKYNKIDGRNVKGLSKEVSQILLQMQWPGNVRELENMMERAVLLAKDETITQNDLFLNNFEPLSDETTIPLSGSLKDMERKMIFHALDQTDGNRTHAADLLGISVRTLRNKLNEYKQKMSTL